MTHTGKIFITLFGAVFATTLGVGLVAPLLPVYARTLGAGAWEIGLIFGAFSLTRTLFVSYFGALSDRRGRKPLLVTGLLLYFLLSLAYTAAQGVVSLVVLRLAQGFASAMILPVAQAYVGEISPAMREGRIMGLFNTSLYGGLSLGPLLGGILKDRMGIQASFLGMAAMTLGAFVLCMVLLPPERRPRDRGSVVLKQKVGFGMLARDRRVVLLVQFRACFMLCIGMTWAFLPLLAHERMGLSGSAIGLVVMINVLVAGLAQVPMGYLADQVSKKALVVAGGFLAIPCFLGLHAAGSLAGLLVANAVFGLAGGTCFPAVMALGVLDGKRVEAMGAVMGFLTLAHSLGMLAGPLLGGIMIDLFSFKALFASGAVVLGAGTLVFWAAYPR